MWRAVLLWVFVVTAWVAVAVIVGRLQEADTGMVTGVYGIRGDEPVR